MTDQTPRELAGLLQAIYVARSAVESARRLKRSPGPATVATEQRLLWRALERYAAALTRQGSPLPYRMRDEVAMYRSMFGTRRER